MKLKIDNSSISQLFVVVSSINEVKKMIEKQEMDLVLADETLKEFRDERNSVAVEVSRRADLLRQGSMEGLQELLHLQFLQGEADKNISIAEMRKAGIEASLALLDDELVSRQKEVDAVLQGRKV